MCACFRIEFRSLFRFTQAPSVSSLVISKDAVAAMTKVQDALPWLGIGRCDEKLLFLPGTQVLLRYSHTRSRTKGTI